MPHVDGALLDAVSRLPHVGVLVVDEYADTPAYAREAQAKVLAALRDRPMWAFTIHGKHLRADLCLPPGTPVIDKPHANAFVRTGLRDALVGAGVKDVVVLGYHEDACVAATIGHLWCAPPAMDDYGAVDLGFVVHTHLHIVHAGSLSSKRRKPLWYAAARVAEVETATRLRLYRRI